MYRNAVLSETTYHDWLCGFKHGYLDADDGGRKGPPKSFQNTEFEDFLVAYRCQLRQELSSTFGSTRKPLPSQCVRWEGFENRELGFFLIESLETLTVGCGPANTCSSSKEGRVSITTL